MDAVQRLNFRLPNFSRVAWVSDDAAAEWASKIQNVSRSWPDIERATVVHGVRSFALFAVGADDFLELVSWSKRSNLAAVMVATEAAGNGGYTATSQPPEPGKPAVYRVAVGSPNAMNDFVHAWNNGNQESVGALLGYPACCRAFFNKIWIEQHWIDTTWPMACNSAAQPIESNTQPIDVNGFPEANILLRWFGVRAVPHLPCSFNCAGTLQLGTQILGWPALKAFRKSSIK